MGICPESAHDWAALRRAGFATATNVLWHKGGGWGKPLPAPPKKTRTTTEPQTTPSSQWVRLHPRMGAPCIVISPSRPPRCRAGCFGGGEGVQGFCPPHYAPPNPGPGLAEDRYNG